MRQVILVTLVFVLALGMTSGLYAWTHNEHIHNNTTQVVNDVHKVLRGRWTVDRMMTDTFPFADWGVVWDGTEWVTRLHWWGADVPPCQYAHVCFTVVDPATGLLAPGAEIKRAWFTYDEEYVDDLTWVISAVGAAEEELFCLYIGNFRMLGVDSLAPSPPVYVTDIAIAFSDECIPIEDMTYEVMYDPGSTLPWQQLPPMDLLVFEQWYQVNNCYPADSFWGYLRMTLYDGIEPFPYHEFMKFEVQPGGPSAAEATTWGRLKGLFR
jgi:hypothetical protein